MFTALQTARPRSRPRILGASLAAHALFLAWLLHTPNAELLSASSVAFGEHGTSITHLYWAKASGTGLATDMHHTARRKQTAQASATSLQLPQEVAKAKEIASAKVNTEMAETVSASASPDPAPAAGTAYGNLVTGSALGDEVRPALPVISRDPIVDRGDFVSRAEGSVIIEITIDAQGNIVAKTVLQSMGPAIDNKVLAALENWRFRPAQRNGVAIPSKQDVCYHFKPDA